MAAFRPGPPLVNGFTMTPGRAQRLLVTALLLVLFYFAWTARDALFPFVLGAVVAYVVSPLVERLAVVQPWYGRKPETARGISVLVVYVFVLAVITVAMLFLLPRIFDEVQQLIDDIPDIVDEAQARLDTWTERYQREVPADVRERINQAVEDFSTSLTNLAESLGKRSLNIVFSTVTSLLGYISVPFFVFYALKDRDRAFGRFYQFFGEGIRPDVRESVRIANRVIGAYVRAQLFLGLVIFLITLVGLELMNIEFALGLAFIAGVTELIPIIGPLIGFVPAFAVVLATEPDKWWWVVLFYLGVQAAENYLLVPRIHSNSVNVHPAIILILLAIGGGIWGLWGVLVVVPLFAAGRDVYSYVHRRLGEEESRRKAALLAAAALPPPPPTAEATPPSSPSHGAPPPPPNGPDSTTEALSNLLRDLETTNQELRTLLERATATESDAIVADAGANEANAIAAAQGDADAATDLAEGETIDIEPGETEPPENEQPAERKPGEKLPD